MDDMLQPYDWTHGYSPATIQEMVDSTPQGAMLPYQGRKLQAYGDRCPDNS